METFLSSLSALTSSLLKVSGQASLLIGLVLLAQWLGRKHLPPRLRYALWLLVVARLMLPVSVESTFSVFNFTMAAPAKVFHAVAAASRTAAAKAEVENAPAPAAAASPAPAPAAVASGASQAPTAPVPSLAPPARSPGAIDSGHHARPVGSASAQPFPWATMLSLVWLAGVLFLLARIIWIPLRLDAQLARHETATSPAVFEILEQSKRLIGVNQVLPIVQSRAVESPALLGFIRPWLLLPEGLVVKFTPQELRLVFLHELAHLKRRDIAVNWLATLLQILHWPNPLVWLAFARMRADRELACDELALSFARTEENKIYGHAIIKLLEGFRRPAALPGLVGILEDQTQMQRRITMIAQFKEMTQWSVAAAGLVLGLGFVTLTDAQTNKEAAPRQEQTAEAGVTTKILITGTGDDASGILSPDETKIAYVDWAKKSGDLVVKTLSTGKIVRLTKGDTETPGVYEYADDGAVWSADSNWIAYTWASGKDQKYDLRMTSLVDGTVRVLIPNSPEAEYYPSDWSVDGKNLLCRRFNGNQQQALAVYSFESGEVRPLISSESGHAGHARFSPDGRFIAFDRANNGNQDVYVLEIGGQQSVRLTDSPHSESKPVWSSDGKVVLFSSDQRGTWDLFGVRIANGRPAAAPFLVTPGFGNVDKRMTRRGNLAFNAKYRETDGYYVDVSPTGADHIGAPKPLARSFAGENASPTWSPDGTKVAYVRNGNLLCVQTLATGSEEVFHPGMRFMSQVIWSSDGKVIAMWPRGPKTNGVHFYDLETRELRPLRASNADRPEKNYRPTGWSPDGREFMFVGYRNDTPSYLAIGITDGKTREVGVSETSEPVGYFEVSPDQTRVAYLTYVRWLILGGEVKLVVADRALKSLKTIASVSAVVTPSVLSKAKVPNGQGSLPRWSPDGKSLAYYWWGEGDGLHVAAADGSWDRIVSTGKLKQARSLVKPPEWSKDGSKLAMTLEGAKRDEIGLLGNFLPQ